MCYCILDLEIHQYQQDSKLLTILILTKWIYGIYIRFSISESVKEPTPSPPPPREGQSIVFNRSLFIKKTTCMTFYLLCQFLAMVDAYRF